MNRDTLKSAAPIIFTMILAAAGFFGWMKLDEWATFKSAQVSLKTGKPLTDKEQHRLSEAAKARTAELERRLGILEKVSDAAEIAKMTSDVLGELYSQWGFEAACYHHISYARVTDAGAALTASTEEARVRYGAYLQICANDAARNSTTAAALTLMANDVFADVRGITRTIDILLDVIGALGVEDRWEELRADILAAREYQNQELSKLAQPLIDGWISDTVDGTSPPALASLI